MLVFLGSELAGPTVIPKGFDQPLEEHRLWPYTTAFWDYIYFLLNY